MGPPVSAAPVRALRDYQAEDTERVRAAWDRGIVRPAIVWATGLGKSDPVAVLAVEEARRGGRVLLLAHRGELLSQLRDRCRAYAPDIRVGRVQAGTREYDAPIVTATVQTASRPDRRARMHRPTLLIVDEAHHAAARTYVTIMRWAGCYDETDPCRALGVTATMDRADKPISEIAPDVKRRVDLGDVWQEIVAERGIVWGIEHGPDPADPWRTLPVWQGPTESSTGDAPEGYAPDGWLVPLIGRVVVGEHVDLTNAKISRTTRDYADNDLGVMVAQDAPEVVKAWWTHALLPDGSHRQTGVFVPTLHAARAYLDAFRASGIATEMVDGTTPAEIRGDVHRRTGIYGRMANGRTQVLVSVGVLTEGWDCPPVSCIMVARPTQLAHLYQQMVGRGTRQMDPRAWRRWDGTPFAPKRDCLVFDVVGATRTGSVHLRTLAKLIPGVPYVGRPCEVCGQPKPCGCVAEPTEDPDDTRTDNRRRLTGPADYETVDLLAGARESGLNWLRTTPTDGYVGIPFLTAGRYYGILWANEDGSWSGGWVTNRGAHDGGWIIESVEEHQARAAVEALWLDGCDGPLGTLAERRDAPWRLARKSPSPRQLAFAQSLGIVNAHTLTAGACGDEIDRVLATRRLVRDF
jgi:superfamily II DNA or RNA helicase